MSFTCNVQQKRIRRDLGQAQSYLARLSGDLDRARKAARVAPGLDGELAHLEVCNATNTASTLGIVLADLRIALDVLFAGQPSHLDREVESYLSAYALEAPCQTI